MNPHCAECEETAARFRDIHWDEVSVDVLLSPCRATPTFLEPAAFHYYLPGLMLRCIESPLELDVIPSSVIGRLSPPNGKVPARDAESFARFTAPQREAIVAFLRVFELRQRIDSGAPEDYVDVMPVDRELTRAIAFWSR